MLRFVIIQFWYFADSTMVFLLQVQATPAPDRQGNSSIFHFTYYECVTIEMHTVLSMV